MKFRLSQRLAQPFAKPFRRVVVVFLLGLNSVFGSVGWAWQTNPPAASPKTFSAAREEPFVLVLGTAQDGGYPQAGCRKPCCQRAWNEPAERRFVVSLAIVDPRSKERWLVECTPDFKQQLRLLDEAFPVENATGLNGIFLTHAHVGHYAGLVNLGREVLGTKNVPTYAMPRMAEFLRTNGPWSQLVQLKNIELRPLETDVAVVLNDRLKITPITVPHRDEFSETVAFRIDGPNHRILFLPDIDKWDRWERKIEEELAHVDVAYLDATFFAADELPGRNMREIPHPFVVETIARFAASDKATRAKVRLIHFNHSNPLLNPASNATRQTRDVGIGIANQLERVEL